MQKLQKRRNIFYSKSQFILFFDSYAQYNKTCHETNEIKTNKKAQIQGFDMREKKNQIGVSALFTFQISIKSTFEISRMVSESKNYFQITLISATVQIELTK